MTSLLLLSACSTVPDRAPVPVALPEPPQRWTADDLSEVIDSGGEPGWADLLGEPVIGSLVEEALQFNPSLSAAAARVEQAAARARIAGADRHPQLNASLDGARRKQNFIGFPIPGAEDQVFSTTTTTWGVGLNVSWEADLWGRIRAGHSAARADADAAIADYRGARLSLGGQTVKAWLTLIEARQQVDLARETLRNRMATEQRIERRYVEGLTPSIDLRLARTNVAVTRAALSAREFQLDAAARQLEILLGRYPAGELEGTDTLPEVPRKVAAGIPSELIARRPDLVAAERRLLASAARTAQANAALYPQFRLTGSAGTVTDDLSNLLDGDFSVWSLAFNLLQPIFQGGRLRANVDLQEAIGDEVAAGFVRAALAAFGEVELAISAEGLLAEQEQALEDAAASASAAETNALERYSAGLADYLLVLESQRQALDARSRLLEVRRQRLAALVNLCIALGGDLEVASETSEETPS